MVAICVAAALLWWPGGLTLRSDDWLAIHWSRDFSNVLHDFVGPYQGAERIALFHRPWITASVFADDRIARMTSGETAAFAPLLANLIVHLANGLLLHLLLRRFVGTATSLAATAWWLLLPGHVEAVSWMIGRVDTHGSFFVLLACWLEAKRFERARRGLPSSTMLPLLAFFVGAWTKELALVLPALAWLHAAWRSPGAIRSRVRAAGRASWPWFAVLTGVLVYRRLVLGEALGGYAEGSLELLRAFEVFGALHPPGLLGTIMLVIAGLFVALRLLRSPSGDVRSPRVRALAAFALLVTLTTALPTAGAAGGEGSRDERYRYLPSTGLAAFLACGGPAAPLALLAAQLAPAWEQRQALRATCRDIDDVRDQLRSTLARTSAPDDPVWIDAKPSIRGFRAFHVGVDRLGLAPFAAENRLVLPRRPLYPGIPAQRSPPAEGSDPLRYAGPNLDRSGFERLRAGDDAFLELETAATLGQDLRARVALAGCFGWLLVTVPASVVDDTSGAPRVRISVKQLLLAVPDSCPPEKNVLQTLWPGVEIAHDPRPRLRLEILDANDTRLTASAGWLPLPITRGLGLLLRAKNPGYLLLALVAAITIVFAHSARPSRTRV